MKTQLEFTEEILNSAGVYSFEGRESLKKALMNLVQHEFLSVYIYYPYAVIIGNCSDKKF